MQMPCLEVSDSTIHESSRTPITGIPRISIDNPPFSYNDFFHTFMLPNRPVILTGLARNWECFRRWAGPENAGVDLNYLRDKLKGLEVPVADCGRSEFNAHCKLKMPFDDFAQYWQNQHQTTDSSKDCPSLYLKDWHLRKALPDYKFYETPSYFGSDWLNEYLVDVDADDYMFVYMGPSGTWTPFHSDVFGSFSWSTNITGTKQWIFLAPGEEAKLADPLGNYPFIVDPEGLNGAGVNYHIVHQSAGETVFVPSGWYHQVRNEADTISVNHNWFNGCNVAFIWQILRTMLDQVRAEIDDCRDMDDFEGHCQLMLRAAHGMNYDEFFKLLNSVARRRIVGLTTTDEVLANGFRLGRCHCLFDLQAILGVIREFLESPAELPDLITCCQTLRQDIEAVLLLNP